MHRLLAAALLLLLVASGGARAAQLPLLGNADNAGHETIVDSAGIGSRDSIAGAWILQVAHHGARAGFGHGRGWAGIARSKALRAIFTVVLIGVIAIPAWLLVRLVITYAIPERIRAVRLLKKELINLEVPIRNLPRAFFRECIDWVLSSNSPAVVGRGDNRKAAIVRAIQTLALTIALWRSDPNNRMFVLQGGRENIYRRMFEKYDFQAHL